MRGLGVALCAVALAACSLVNDPGRHQGGASGVDGGPRLDGSAPVDAGAPPLAGEEACGAFTEAYCAAYDACCEMQTRTIDQCRMDVLVACMDFIEPLIDDPRTAYDPQRAGDLIAEANTIAEGCDPAIAELFTYDLLDIFRGSSLDRTICINATQIANEQYAGLLSCSREAGLTCRPNPAPLGDWTCQDFSTTGGACMHYVHCQRGQYCAGPNIFTTGTCMLRRGIGSPCETADQCESLNCSTGMCRRLDQTVYCTELLPGVPMVGEAM
jgi:hypothetical protein